MKTIKTNHEEFVAIFGAEVTELSAKVYSTKSPDELLTSYQGREKELLINLRKLAFKQQVSGLCWSSFHGLHIITTILMQCHSLTVWRGEEGNAPRDNRSRRGIGSSQESRWVTGHVRRKRRRVAEEFKIIKIKKEKKAATIAEIHTLIDAMGLPKTAMKCSSPMKYVREDCWRTSVRWNPREMRMQRLRRKL